jgi:hypothetical protein
VASGSVAEKANDATLLFTVPDGPESMFVSGSLLSTITGRLAEIVKLNATSTARAVTMAVPSPIAVESQIIL